MKTSTLFVTTLTVCFKVALQICSSNVSSWLVVHGFFLNGHFYFNFLFCGPVEQFSFRISYTFQILLLIIQFWNIFWFFKMQIQPNLKTDLPKKQFGQIRRFSCQCHWFRSLPIISYHHQLEIRKNMPSTISLYF